MSDLAYFHGYIYVKLAGFSNFNAHKITYMVASLYTFRSGQKNIDFDSRRGLFHLRYSILEALPHLKC